MTAAKGVQKQPRTPSPQSRPQSSGASGRKSAGRVRAQRLLMHEIEFLDNESFREPDVDEAILGAPEPLLEATATDPDFARLTRGMNPALARFCECPLLTSEEEARLFRRMNFLRFRANQLRSRLNESRPSKRLMDEIESLLDESRQCRDRIIRANLRLVISIVRKHSGAILSFDELLSEGCLSLSQAVDKFDYARGFRFSTYAYRAVSRKIYRAISERHRQESRFATGTDATLINSVEDASRTLAQDDRVERLRTLLMRFMHHLDRREQLIIRSRYALGAHRKVRTFQNLGDRLGISKERARQLEQRAVAKLKGLADEVGVTEVLDESAFEAHPTSAS